MRLSIKYVEIFIFILNVPVNVDISQLLRDIPGQQ